jgi:hypothetical protein
MPLYTGAVGNTPPVNLRATRSNINDTAHQMNTSSQLATIAKKKANAKEGGMEACRTLMEEDYLSDETTITPQTLLHALLLIIQKHSTSAPPELTEALTALATLMKEIENTSTQPTLATEALVQSLGEHIERLMMNGMDKISTLIKSSMADQCRSTSSLESLTEAVNTLKLVASDMNKTISKATTATSQINDTALTYKEALLHTTAQATQPQATKNHNTTHTDNTGLLLGIDKKARQVLFDNTKGEDNHMNIYEIKEKATIVMKGITPAHMQGTEIQEVIKLRNGGIILQFASKEAADWVRTPTNEIVFTRKFDPDTTIRDCIHPIMVPRIPLTFNPNNPEHLSEIEEVNRLPPKTIKKARWIKPEYRRAPGQSCAHAIFTISSVTEANRLIKDGIYVCNNRLFPKKLKYSMKCRKWGHFAADCRAQVDTCGTCGVQHKTSKCKVENKRFCVSC